MLIQNTFEIGQTVYLRTDKEQLPRIVTAITVRPESLVYALSCGERESIHYAMEISSEKDVLITTSDS